MLICVWLSLKFVFILFEEFGWEDTHLLVLLKVMRIGGYAATLGS